MDTKTGNPVVRGICGAVAGVCAIVGLFLVVNAYFVFSVDTKTGAGWDGLGRRLSPTPGVMRHAYGEMWAGWGWFPVDCIVGLVLAGTVIWCGTFAATGKWPEPKDSQS